MSNNSSNALNYLETHKRLSQRIAIAQLRGEAIASLRGENLRFDEEKLIKEFLIDENILSEDEANLFKFVAILGTDTNKIENILKKEPLIKQLLINERILSEEEANLFKLGATLETDTNNKPSKVLDLRDFTFNIFGVSNQHLATLISLGNLAPNDTIPIPFDVLNKIIDFIDSPSNQPPWSLVETVSVAVARPTETKRELEEKLAPLATKVKENGSSFNVLQPSKKLSQLIAQSWLPDGDTHVKDVFTEGNSDKVKSFLKDCGLLSELDAQHAKIIVDRRNQLPCDPNSTGVVYIGEVTLEKDDRDEFTIYNITIPYPTEPPAELISNPQILEEWVNSPDGEQPYTPVGISPVQISRWIPLTC